VGAEGPQGDYLVGNIQLWPSQEFNPEMLAFMNANWRLLQDLLNGHITSDNLDADAIEAANIADGAVTQAKAADGVAKIFSGTFTGNGAADREIDVGYRLRYVKLLKHDDAKVFESIGTSLVDLATWIRDSAGTVTQDTAEWAGVSANGFTSGSNADGGDSNLTGVTYSYIAFR